MRHDPEMVALVRAVREALNRELLFQCREHNGGRRAEIDLDRLAATAVRELIDFLDKPEVVH